MAARVRIHAKDRAAARRAKTAAKAKTLAKVKEAVRRPKIAAKVKMAALPEAGPKPWRESSAFYRAFYGVF
jgi:hypothetical protein